MIVLARTVRPRHRNVVSVVRRARCTGFYRVDDEGRRARKLLIPKTFRLAMLSFEGMRFPAGVSEIASAVAERGR